jgi:hypothetical protein
MVIEFVVSNFEVKNKGYANKAMSFEIKQLAINWQKIPLLL